MISSSNSVGAVGSESSKHSKHRITLRLFYSLIVFVVGAALLPVLPASAAPKLLASAASAYFPVNPTRVMDTRNGTGGVAIARLVAGGSVSLVVAPNALAGVPANATAVVMNVTVTNTDTASYLTVYPTGGGLPVVSNLNWVPGYTVPNLVTVQVGTGGSVTFYNKFGNTDVIADISGYFALPTGVAGYEVGTGFPQRLVDTRTGSGFLGAGTSVGPGVTTTYQVTGGTSGVPAGASAVIVNSTVTNTTAASFLTLWAAGATRNTVSNDNWVAGWTRANRAIVPLSASGQLSVYNQFGSVDVILDVNGYFTGPTSTQVGKLFTAVTPVRLTDHQPLGPNSSFPLTLTATVGATAAVLDVVVSETTAPSYLAVYPTGSPSNTSDVNWVAGQVNPNLTVTTLGAGGSATFFNSAGNVNVSVDLQGYFGGQTGVVITANPTSLAANPGGPTSKVDVTVFDNNGVPIALDPVSFTLTPSVAGSCGTGLASQTTNGAGKIPQQTYTPTAVVGTCLITATEAIGARSSSVVITQTAPPNKIVFAPDNTGGASIPVAANGSVVSFTTTTTNSATATPIQGDTLTFTTSGGASCGTIGNVLPAGGVSPANGQVTFDYTASTTVGFCTITAMESKTSATNSVLVSQRVPGGTANASALTNTTTTTILANGTDTVALTDTVTGTSGFANDAVLFTVTPSVAGACGAVSPASGVTTSGGVLTTTYTASTTSGTCRVAAFEANGGTSSSIVITQNPVPNKVVASANPATITATTSSTSTLTVTVTNGVSGAAVVGDVISFSAIAPASDPGGNCGAITGNTTPTNASGQVTATYTSTAVPGFCTITASDTTAGGSGKVRITETNPASAALVTTVVANPTSVPADGTAAASTVTATIKTSGGTLVPDGDHVQWTVSGSPAATCPATPASANTVGGQVSFAYNATTTVGTCTITATEANSGSSGSATVTQTAVPNAVTFTTITPVQTEGGGASSIVAHVAHLGTAVASDLVTFTTGGGAACGVFNPTSGTTPAGAGTSGNVTTAYTPSLTVGFCTITATESATSGSVSATITQTTNPAAVNTIAVVAAVLTPGTAADGANTSAITATVNGANRAGDPVMFILTEGVAGSGACGTITPTSGVTSASFTLSASYKVSTKPGLCNITATEANGGSTSPAAGVTSTPRPNNITLTANPTAVSTSGGGTSTLTVTVTNANTGVGVNADAITFTLTPSGVGGTCGSLSPTNGPTNTSGVFTTTYTTGAVIGSCSIVAHEGATVQDSTAVVITQTA